MQAESYYIRKVEQEGMDEVKGIWEEGDGCEVKVSGMIARKKESWFGHTHKNNGNRLQPFDVDWVTGHTSDFS